MNHKSMIDQMNAVIRTIRHDEYTDADVSRLIELSPGHYFDMALQYKRLESPHHTLNALNRSLIMMDERNPLVDYFLHRLTGNHYDHLIVPLLKMPSEARLIQGFSERAFAFTRIPGLIGKVVQMMSLTKTTSRLVASDINDICIKIEQRPHGDSLPQQQFWDECRRAAQIRETLLKLSENDVREVDSIHRKRGVLSAFMLSFFEDLKGDDFTQLKKGKSLFGLSPSDIQDSFNLAFSLTRDHFENEIKRSNDTRQTEKVRGDIVEASERIRQAVQDSFGMTLDKPKRILNALDHLQGKARSSSARSTEALTIN